MLLIIKCAFLLIFTFSFVLAPLSFGCQPAKNSPVSPSKTPVLPDHSSAFPISPDNPRAVFQTNLGTFTIECFPQAARFTVQNFQRYISNGYYNNSLFHRVIPHFIIQAGGLDKSLKVKATNPPVRGESPNGLKNFRGSVAMARLFEQPDSATSQFFINIDDNNNQYDYIGPLNPGYTVFGFVCQGMDVVDKIASSLTTNGKTASGEIIPNFPVEPVIIQSVLWVEKK